MKTVTPIFDKNPGQPSPGRSPPPIEIHRNAYLSHSLCSCAERSWGRFLSDSARAVLLGEPVLTTFSPRARFVLVHVPHQDLLLRDLPSHPGSPPLHLPIFGGRLVQRPARLAVRAGCGWRIASHHYRLRFCTDAPAVKNTISR